MNKTILKLYFIKIYNNYAIIVHLYNSLIKKKEDEFKMNLQNYEKLYYR